MARPSRTATARPSRGAAGSPRPPAASGGWPSRRSSPPRRPPRGTRIRPSFFRSKRSALCSCSWRAPPATSISGTTSRSSSSGTARRAISASRLRPFKMAWGRGSSRCGTSRPTGSAARCSPTPSPRSARSSIGWPSSTTWSARRGFTPRRRSSSRPDSFSLDSPALAAGSATRSARSMTTSPRSSSSPITGATAPTA